MVGVVSFLDILGIKHRMAILHLVLDHYAKSLKDSLVFGNTVMETLVKNIEVFEAPVEGFMAGFHYVLEFLRSAAVKCVTGTDLYLTPVAFIPDHPLVGRDLAFQTAFLPINRNIILSSGKRTVDPYKLIAMDRNP